MNAKMSLSRCSSFFSLKKIAFQVLIQLLSSRAPEKAFCWLASRKVVFNFAQRYFSSGLYSSKAKLTIPNRHSLTSVLPTPGTDRGRHVHWLPVSVFLVIWFKWALKKTKGDYGPWLILLYIDSIDPFSLIWYVLSGCFFMPPCSFCIWYVAIITRPLRSGIKHSLRIPIA